MDNRSIGVFDSGVGGLTVLKEIMKLMPSESTVYFGDCGRAPYGIKSEETIIKYTFQDIRFLLSQDIKMMVIACNTASAYGHEPAKKSFEIPMVEVVNPGANTVVKVTENKRVGVIGTTATISSGVYRKAINKINNSIEIFSKACPLFVNLVEEGWWDNDIAYRIAQEYLIPLKDNKIDTLVMGCTHYPLLQSTISKVLGQEIKLVSSAREVAKVVKDIINEKHIARDESSTPVYRYYTSDSVEKFQMLGNSILNMEIDDVEKIDIEKY